ncbi:MAG TPA: hypothetical protein VK789_17130 [Bryobacteraceae bacterium]|nr:hypothetical protein [Bryobacteraceae bacterium]
MKPLHAGLLIAGAALAGGLAVKMTQPQPLPVATPAPVPMTAPIQQVISPAPSADPVQPKPSPFSTQVTPAPEEVFVESVQPEIRKNEPILTAKAAPPAENPSPLFVPPAPYEAPAAPPAVAKPQPEPKVATAPAPEPQPSAAPSPRRVTLPAGMIVPVRLNQALSSERSVTGATFDASLAEPLVVDGLVIAERGSRVAGRIVDAQKSGRLALELASIFTTDGQKISVSTDPWTKRPDSSPGEDAAKIGGGAALGAIIGAIAGGGKGAAIGAGVGGGVGVGAVAASRGKPANLASETIVRFRLATRVTITERQL